MSNFNLGYDYQPDDVVWVVDPIAQSVHEGVVTQVDAKIYRDATSVVPTSPATTPPILDHLMYWVNLNNSNGSKRVTPDNIFATLTDALNALAIDVVTHTPTPSVTPTFTPTPSPTPSATTTPTPTPSPTIQPTPPTPTDPPPPG